MAQSRVKAANPFRDPINDEFDPTLNTQYTY